MFVYCYVLLCCFPLKNSQLYLLDFAVIFCSTIVLIFIVVAIVFSHHGMFLLVLVLFLFCQCPNGKMVPA